MDNVIDFKKDESPFVQTSYIFNKKPSRTIKHCPKGETIFEIK